LSRPNAIATFSNFEGWHKAEARFSLTYVLKKGLAHMVFPTCLLELGVVWILVPYWGALVTLPFLVLPTLNLVLLKMTGGTTTHWNSCEARFQNGRLTVRLPAKDFIIFIPSDVKVLAERRLEVRGKGSKICIDFSEPLKSR